MERLFLWRYRLGVLFIHSSIALSHGLNVSIGGLLAAHITSLHRTPNDPRNVLIGGIKKAAAQGAAAFSYSSLLRTNASSELELFHSNNTTRVPIPR